MNRNSTRPDITTPELTAVRREIKARYLTAGMAVIRDGFGDPLTVSVVHRYADDTILVQFDEVTGELPYHPEEGVTVVDLTPDAPAAEAETTVRQRLAAELHRLADDIVRLELPVGAHARLSLGVLDSRADLERLRARVAELESQQGGAR
ncbi:hypothetical protein ACIBJE_02305 [Micromonospora sp. NPDC050187]|uniref:hypothetical protein n=1 Tax=Micromonospora sp. NPDC050187 TaxID=3364277 RepID=UPI00378E8D7F